MVFFWCLCGDFSSDNLTGAIPSELEITDLQNLALAFNNNFCPIVDYSSWALSTDYLNQPTSCLACATAFPTCQNEGICSGGANTTFTCTCPLGSIGVNCQSLLFCFF